MTILGRVQKSESSRVDLINFTGFIIWGEKETL